MAYGQGPTATSLVQLAIVLLGLASCAEAKFYRLAPGVPFSVVSSVYTLAPLNQGPLVNITSVDFSVLNSASISAAETALLTGAPLVFSGTIVGTKLVVAAVYLGFPGFQPKNLFVTVRNGTTTYTASVLNTVKTLSLVKSTTKLAVTGSLVDVAYQMDQVLRKGAIVSSAPPVSGAITASEVFIKLPAVVGPCPVIRLAACPTGQIRTFYRTPALCVLPGPCKRSTVCTLALPICPSGYTRHSWVSATGCPAYACDPNFITGFP